MAENLKNNFEATKKCRYCFKDVPAKATKCPYCQSNIISAVDSAADFFKLIGTAVAVIIGFIVLLFIFDSGGNSTDTAGTPNQSPTTNTPAPVKQTQTAPKKTATETTEIQYKKISLSEIPNNFVESTNAGVDITATAIKGMKAGGYIFVYLQDKNGYAILHVGPKDRSYKTIIDSVHTGDVVTIQALAPQGVHFCSSGKEAESLCASLGIPIDAPYLMLSGSGLAIIEKSGNSERLIHIDYSVFQKINDSDYAKNPPAYLNKKIKISDLLVSDFLAAGDRGGDSNYILTLDGTNPISMTHTLLLIDTGGYQKAVAALNEGNFITVYGTGAESHQFSTSLGGTVLKPVVKVWRIDGSVGTIFEVNP